MPLDVSQIHESSSPPNPGGKERKEEEYLLEDMDRRNRMEKTIHACKRALLVLSFFIIILIILIRVYGLVAPHCWQWLTESQNAKIDEFFVHGTIGAIVAGYLGKYFKSKE